MLSTIFRRLLIKAASTRICFEENGKIFQVHTFRFQIRYFYTDWPSDSEITNLKILLEREIKMWYCYPTRDQILWRRSFFIRHTTNGKWRFKNFHFLEHFQNVSISIPVTRFHWIRLNEKPIRKEKVCKRKCFTIWVNLPCCLFKWSI